MWSENSSEIKYSYIKPLVLETFLTPHSSLHTPQLIIYIIRCIALWHSLLSIKNVKITLFLKNIDEKFWRFARNVYLCIRFRAERCGSNSKKEFFDRFT